MKPYLMESLLHVLPKSGKSPLVCDRAMQKWKVREGRSRSHAIKTQKRGNARHMLENVGVIFSGESGMRYCIIHFNLMHTC